MPTTLPPAHRRTKPVSGDGSEFVRQRIILGARQHFFVHGFRSVTMDDLAEELGMSKKTLYAHFTSKAKLLEAVVFDKFSRVNQDMERITSSASADISSTLRELPACLLRHLQEIQPPFVRDMHRDAPDLFKQVQARRRKIFALHLGKVLAQGRKEGIVRKDIPAGLMMEILLGTLDSVMIPPKLMELGLHPKTMLSTIMTIFFHGVITKTGRTKS